MVKIILALGLLLSVNSYAGEPQVSCPLKRAAAASGMFAKTNPVVSIAASGSNVGGFR